MNNLIPVFVLAILISTNSLAQDRIDESLLSGEWCYKSILANGSSDVKAVNTNWIFSDDGRVEIQSQWMRDTTSVMSYTFTDGMIDIPKINKKYEVRKLAGTEMLLINSLGSSENTFLKGRCN